MNSTETVPNSIQDFYVVCSFSGAFALIAVAISIVILILVWRTKPRLHTVRHLLMCNTSTVSILYCIVTANNYVFLIFFPEQTSDMSCRWRGYFSYVTICGVLYSFLIQAISRLFICVFSTKYRWLATFKVHYVLIGIQWFVSIVAPLPAIITDDIYFRPTALCWVPLKRLLHVVYTYVVYYMIPALSICVIYIFIYYRVKKAANRAMTVVRPMNNDKRDLELLRNILILLIIYLMGGCPTLLFLMTSNRVLYLIGVVTISLGVAVEKICTILLDRELRQVVRQLISKTDRVTPIGTKHTIPGHQGNLAQTQPGVMQSVSNKQRISAQVM